MGPEMRGASEHLSASRGITRVVTIAGHRVLVGLVRRTMAQAREANALAKNTRNVAVLRRALRARGAR